MKVIRIYDIYVGYDSLDSTSKCAQIDLSKHLPSGKLTYLLNMAIEIVDLRSKHGDFP